MAHDKFQEPYLGKFVDEPNMGLVDRHEPEWIDLNRELAAEAIKFHREELKIYQKQTLDWLVAGNAGGIFLASYYLSLKFTDSTELIIMTPTFISFLLGLISGWIATFYNSRRAASLVRFYNKNSVYLQSLKLYQHNKIDTTHYWKSANSAANELDLLLKLPARWVLSSCVSFMLGILGFLICVLLKRLG